MADLASQIDLREHGIIEAHAGTGKTHTIVELTLRILQENNSGRLTHIREILLVTYTEKAAAELRARIRQGLEKRITTLSNQGENPKNAVLAAHLSDCLNNLHEALIGTIHGTCLRLLQSYPFETGMSFQSQMVSDRTGLEETLRDCLRQDWQEEKTKIPWALDFLRKRQIAWTEQDFQLVIATANALLDPNAQLSRAAAKGQTLSELYQTWLSFQEFSPELKQDFADKLKVVCDRIGEILQKPIGFDEERLQVLRTIQAQWSAGTAVSEQNPTAFRKRDQFGRKKLFTQASRKHPKTQALQDDLEAVAQHKRVHQLEDAEQFAQWVHAALICDAAEILRDRWQEEKRRQGLISFQDMLNLLHQAIQARPSFRQILRARLRYGIIDEFQDTSALQWEIFRRLFLEDDHGPRLYLVGDPKQSIYSFQGADVRSYLAARQQIAKVYSLRDNYRSLPATIEGYNQVLQTNADSGGWFGAIGISYDHPATSPPRQEACPLPSDPPWLTEALYHPVQVISLDGKANVRKHQLAEAVARIVHALHGRSLPVPNGPSWNMEPLQYHHFAVLVEKHSLAKSFQEEFQRQGIPCSKYHMGGLFGSDMALHLRALFEAIIAPPEEATTRQAALLTVFANRAPESLDVQKDLAPESPWSQALAHWAYLAEDFHWARLFRDILQRTRVRERLAGLLDGDRQQADLRQIMDYAIDFLYRDNTGLSTLVQHLRRLQKGNEEAGQDQDLLAKETEQSCVQILTMHASKGLQFPIVFLATAGSDSHMRHLACWTDAQQKRQVQPRPHALDLPGMNDAKTAVRQQAAEERRRLLYVALTRPQTLLFLPIHEENGEPPSRNPDRDLSPTLRALLNAPQAEGVTRFQPSATTWIPLSAVPTRICVDHLDARPGLPELEARLQQAEQHATEVLSHLELFKRARLQTSYTGLSRHLDSDRNLDHGQEPDPEPIPDQPSTQIPRGRQAGNALHEILEHALLQKSLDWVGREEPPQVFQDFARTRLEENRLPQESLSPILQIVERALDCSYELPGGTSVRLASLPLTDRRPETEFHLGVEPDWIHGFMDLVFRLDDRYYVLDWKSNSLPEFTEERIAQSMKADHYDLQAKLYCHALHRHLQGLLGTRYQPAQQLGFAVYVYLRAFETHSTVPIWTHAADPQADAAYVQTLMRQYREGT